MVTFNRYNTGVLSVSRIEIREPDPLRNVLKRITASKKHKPDNNATQ